MSKSTPADLAVAFRSLERRRREAIEAAEGVADVSGPLADLDGHVAAAAGMLGTAADPTAVADAIAAAPAADWDEATLDTLRQHATDAGTALRRLIDSAPASGQ